MYSSLTALSREQHASLCLRPVTDYSFAAKEAVLPLVGAEIAMAIQSFPIAFVMQPGGACNLVAVFGLDAGQNLYVSADGRWLGGYQPAAVRCYPFRLARNNADADPVVCIDLASKLFSENEGQPLFIPDGTPSETLNRVINFLSELERGKATVRVDAVDQVLRVFGKRLGVVDAPRPDEVL